MATNYQETESNEATINKKTKKSKTVKGLANRFDTMENYFSKFGDLTESVSPVNDELASFFVSNVSPVSSSNDLFNENKLDFHRAQRCSMEQVQKPRSLATYGENSEFLKAYANDDLFEDTNTDFHMNFCLENIGTDQDTKADEVSLIFGSNKSPISSSNDLFDESNADFHLDFGVQRSSVNQDKKTRSVAMYGEHSEFLKEFQENENALPAYANRDLFEDNNAEFHVNFCEENSGIDQHTKADEIPLLFGSPISSCNDLFDENNPELNLNYGAQCNSINQNDETATSASSKENSAFLKSFEASKVFLPAFDDNDLFEDSNTEFHMNFCGQTNENGRDNESVDKNNDYCDNDSPTSFSWNSLSSNCSFDDSFQFAESYTPAFDELPIFSIKSVSPISPITGELSLLNLSVSPISSNNDLSEENVNDFNLNFGASSTFSNLNVDDDERISLEEIHAQINTPPSAKSRNLSKRLNLETIFEGVFLETPPKKRKSNSWRTNNSFRDFTVERINTYVMEQRHALEFKNEITDKLCDIFDDKINIIS